MFKVVLDQYMPTNLAGASQQIGLNCGFYVMQNV